MKKMNISLITILTISNLAYAGGGFVEPTYEAEDVVMAEEVYVEEYVAPIEKYEEYVAPAKEVREAYVPPVVKAPPVVVKSMPVPVPTKRAIPVPVPVPLTDIAVNGLYAGIGISAAKFKTNCKCSTGATGTGRGSTAQSGIDKTAGLMGRIGYDVNQYIGIEARGIRTNWKSDGGKIKHVGVFVKPMYPVGEATNLYALAGVAKTTTQGKLQRVDSSSFAWGAGVEYDISHDSAKNGRYNRAFDGHGDQEQGLGVFADYERLIQKSGSPDLDTVNVGLTYDF
jgi:OOP family OmpA-OmpF porin